MAKRKMNWSLGEFQIEVHVSMYLQSFGWGNVGALSASLSGSCSQLRAQDVVSNCRGLA